MIDLRSLMKIVLEIITKITTWLMNSPVAVILLMLLMLYTALIVCDPFKKWEK